MNYYEKALELKDETITHRRYFHRNAEIGLNIPKVQFNEDICPMGAAALAHCATEWLKNNQSLHNKQQAVREGLPAVCSFTE